MKNFLVIVSVMVGCVHGFVPLPVASASSPALGMSSSSFAPSCSTAAVTGRRRKLSPNRSSSNSQLRMFDVVVPQVADKLVHQEGWTYIDVRGDREFKIGHPAGALNIPAFYSTAEGMAANPDFVDQVAKLLPDKKSKLVTGCQLGSRAPEAAGWLEEAGYSSVVSMEGGYSAWAKDGSLPVEK